MQFPRVVVLLAVIGVWPVMVALSQTEPSAGSSAQKFESPKYSVTKAAPFRGKLVLFGAQRSPGSVVSILALRPDEGELETILELNKGELIVSGRVAPNGCHLAYSLLRRDGKKQVKLERIKPEVWLLGADGQRRKVAEDGTVVAWSPDGTKLICYRGPRNDYESFTVDVETKQEQRLPIPGTDVVEDMSPDGKLVAVMQGNPNEVFKHPDPEKGIYPLRQIYLLNLEGDKREDLTSGPMQDNICSCFSPDGKEIAYTSRRYYGDGTLRHSTMVRDSDGKGEKEIIHFDKFKQEEGYESFRPSCPPRWSPDGKLVVTLADKAKWVPTGREGMEVAYRTMVELVFVSPEKGLEKRLDLSEKGVVWVQYIDWR